MPTVGDPESGLGDFNLFATYIAVQKPGLTMGIGPQFVAPTASEDVLGAGKWQAGAAFVLFAEPAPNLQLGSLVTWQASFAGDEDRDATSLLALQPFVILQIGGGWYFRSTAIAPFNLRTGDYSVPLGLGVGRVVRSGHVVFNFFGEPQFTVLHEGAGQPAFQVFAGLNLQLVKTVPR